MAGGNRNRSARACGIAAALTLAGAIAAAPAGASGEHLVAPGETLSGIAAAHGISGESLAAWNGLSAEHLVVEGTTLSVPAPEEVGGTGAATAAAPVSGLAPIWSPAGTLYLEASAAQAWNAMRGEALAAYGVDLYPAGPVSAYRTSEQQGELYDLFLSGLGAPANPPGGSSHEQGLSVDLASEEMLTVVEQIGWRYGWGRFEAPGEWWHITYVGG